MIRKACKTLMTTLAAAAALAGGVFVAPSAALAAQDTAPTGTVADWAWTAPWATPASGGPWAQPCNGTLPINLNGDRCGTGNGGGWYGVGTDLVPFAQAATLSGTAALPHGTNRAGLQFAPELGLGRYANGACDPGMEDCYDIVAWPSMDTMGYAAVINRTATGTPSSVTVDVRGALASLGFTSAFYVDGADSFTGIGSARITRSNGGDVASTAVAVPGGVRIDFPAAAYAGSPGWTRAWVDVVGLRADGSRALVRVLQNTATAGTGSAQSLALSTPVNVPLDIALTDLQFAVSPTAAQVIVDELPGTVTRGEAAFTFVSAVPTTDTFSFRGAFAVEDGWLESPSGTVTVTATDAEVEEPEVVTAPTVRDYAFDAPLAAGVPVTVDVIALTEGEGFDSADWALEASDAVPSSVQGGILTLTPERDREALATTVRWRSLADASVVSNWASITAPAAEVIEPPVVEPPVVTPPVIEPPVVEPPVTTPPVVAPPVVEPPAVTPASADPAQPTPPSIVKTGVEGSPAGFLMGLLAVIVAAGSLPLFRRFARR